MRQLTVFLAAGVWACGSSHQPGTDVGSADTGTDTAADTMVETDTAPDTTPEDTDVDTTIDTAAPDTPAGIYVSAIRAPDAYSVEITLAGAGDANWLTDPENYLIASEREVLRITSVVVARLGDDARVTLETVNQRLGMTYAIEIFGDDETPYLADEFVAADTAMFWVYDWADAGSSQAQITANRVAVGEHGVVYVAEGQRLQDAEAILEDFDALIYPTETDALSACPDMDDNGKVVILGLAGHGYFGGYFDSVNSLPDSESMAYWDYHSNEMEIVHLATDTPIDGFTTLAHEFQHLLYHERHGFGAEYWDYHDEGLAEIAVQMVYGRNDVATEYLLSDYEGRIAGGLSMVHWNYAVYDNYVLAYTFLSYLGAQAETPSTIYQALFDLETGSPDEVDALLSAEFGRTFAEMHFDSWIAVWLQEASGRYSFGELASFSRTPPTVPPGTESVDLEPYGAAHFVLADELVERPATVGANVMYAGINAAGEVDLEAPYDIDGGALITYNGSQDFSGWSAEHSGPDLPALRPPVQPAPVVRMSEPPQRWHHPPVRDPHRPEAWERWMRDRRLAVEGR